ncbi:unnamed protein product [Peronospora belbahrii]|uniref:Peptidase M13 N-terminal domain-containing protein n=1 Tax=Peronospora belbahrii TaxID=622444 RepID=A0AAU9LD87_9STRA|nr:unnamed protein product [Peronospora belbahrii]
MPGPEYYLDRNQFGSTRDAFHAYVMELFRLVGLELRAAASRASAVVAFEQTLAPLFEQEEQSKDSAAPFSRLLQNLTAQDVSLVIKTPAFFDRAEMLVTGDSVTLNTLKAVLTYNYVDSYTTFLGEPFQQTSFSFFGRSLSGIEPDKYFARVRFDNTKAQLASQLVAQLQSSMRKNLEQVDWLDGPTRQAALEKLGNMTTLVGYSHSTEQYPIVLHGDASLAVNMRIIFTYKFNYSMARIGTTVNRTSSV